MSLKSLSWLAEPPKEAPPFAIPVGVTPLPELPQISYSARIGEVSSEEDYLKLQQRITALYKNLQQRLIRVQQQIVQGRTQPNLQPYVLQWEQEVAILQTLLPQLLNTLE